jgi:hypothetical protein
MARTARKLLEEFDSLSDADRAEVVAEVLGRAASSQHGFPKDGDLTAAADGVFLSARSTRVFGMKAWSAASSCSSTSQRVIKGNASYAHHQLALMVMF